MALSTAQVPGPSTGARIAVGRFTLQRSTRCEVWIAGEA
jgi:hypothetical protein